MTTSLDAPERAAMTEKEARKRVKEMSEFYSHLATYVMVMLLLVAINLLTGPGYLWFVWPLLGWGLGVALHGIDVFGPPWAGGRRWQERKMQELMGQAETRADLDALRRELRSLESSARKTPDDGLTRLRQRIENLEAIVTSRDWDLLEADYRKPTPEVTSPPPLLSALDAEEPAEPTPEEKAARLARRTH